MITFRSKTSPWSQSGSVGQTAEPTKDSSQTHHLSSDGQRTGSKQGSVYSLVDLTDHKILTSLNLSLILGKKLRIHRIVSLEFRYKLERPPGVPLWWSGRGGCSTSSAPSWCWWGWACCVRWLAPLVRKRKRVSASPGCTVVLFLNVVSSAHWLSLAWSGFFSRHLSAAKHHRFEM